MSAMNRGAGWSTSSRVSTREPVVVAMPKTPGSLQITALFTAAIVATGATSPTYAASSISTTQRASPPAIAVLSRQQDAPFDAAAMLEELRLRANFTWDDLGKLLNVSRRSVHSWAAGAVMKLANQEALTGLLDRVRALGANRPFVIRQMVLEQAGVAPASTRKIGFFAGTPILEADQSQLVKIKTTKSSSKIRDTRK